MKHPLTSKERRGLLAVALAALLCIAAGFVARSCNGGQGANAVGAVNEVSLKTDSIGLSDSNVSDGKKRKGKSRKQNSRSKKTKERANKPAKTYPTRDPLSQPCD